MFSTCWVSFFRLLFCLCLTNCWMLFFSLCRHFPKLLGVGLRKSSWQDGEKYFLLSPVFQLRYMHNLSLCKFFFTWLRYQFFKRIWSLRGYFFYCLILRFWLSLKFSPPTAQCTVEVLLLWDLNCYVFSYWS